MDTPNDNGSYSGFEYRERYKQHRMTAKTICCICGNDLDFFHVAGVCKIDLIDFFTKESWEITDVDLCDECITKLMANIQRKNKL